MLKFYDENQTEFASSPLRTTHDGHLGGACDKLIYVKNDDLTVYYTQVSIVPGTSSGDILGEWGETGFGLKLIYGETRPTETEWDQVINGEAIVIPDIGATSSADTDNFYPFWCRVICPTNQSAQIKNTMYIKAQYIVKQVGT